MTNMSHLKQDHDAYCKVLVSCVTQVIGEKSHVLHNKNIDPKRAMTRGAKGGDACKKIFVGGVSPDMPETEIREYFDKFGKVNM